ncbi:DndE family protein [Cyclobacterium xiamenense]|uniref:DndE family protein n=1 Tax=Cyclobacterium xiamenense TaxID=1297121 RepID=UPI0035CEDF57
MIVQPSLKLNQIYLSKNMMSSMWHQINIHTSKANKEVVQKLSRKILGGATENVIARIALGYSLQTGRKFTSGEFKLYDSGGKNTKSIFFLMPSTRTTL